MNVWIYLCHVEGIPLEGHGLFDCHHLDVERPGGKIVSADGIVKVAYRIIRIGGAQISSSVNGEIFCALISLEISKGD